jgi:23S rRNA (pseudouridine1915-N3)-methyltransferase
MKFVLLHVQSSKEKWCEEAVLTYTEKIKHFVSFEVQTLTSKKLARAAAAAKLELESEEILQFLTPDDFVVLFDENGKNLTSELFAASVGNILMSGKKRCVWIIGGAFGVSQTLKSRVQQKVSLAPFVLNHQVAQVVAMEQLYRAFCILKNLPYHNAERA